jgi:hypothetical protein
MRWRGYWFEATYQVGCDKSIVPVIGGASVGEKYTATV